MTNKELYYFACQCLSLDDHPEFKEEISHLISIDQIDWEDFVQLCSNHLVLPAIYLKFRLHGLLRYLPEELTKFLEEIYDLNLTRNEHILKQLQEIISLFNEHEIHPTLLKGTANLLDDLYISTGERMIGDIDILVSEKDYLKAAQLLENNGYAHNNPNYFEVENMKHYPRLFKEGVSVDVEIHQRPVPTEYTKMYNTGMIDKEKKAIRKYSSCFVPSDEHKVIHNFIHTQLSNKGHRYGIVPLRDLYDLYLLSKRTDIAQIVNHIEHKRIAVTYFLFAAKALCLPDFFHSKGTFTFKMFCLKHDLVLQSNTFYSVNKGLIYMAERIYSYIEQLIKSIYSKDMRKSLGIRLTNGQWYKNHIDDYIKFFRK
jgi:hypothetical protein